MRRSGGVVEGKRKTMWVWRAFFFFFEMRLTALEIII